MATKLVVDFNTVDTHGTVAVLDPGQSVELGEIVWLEDLEEVGTWAIVANIRGRIAEAEVLATEYAIAAVPENFVTHGNRFA